MGLVVGLVVGCFKRGWDIATKMTYKGGGGDTGSAGKCFVFNAALVGADLQPAAGPFDKIDIDSFFDVGRGVANGSAILPHVEFV